MGHLAIATGGGAIEALFKTEAYLFPSIARAIAATETLGPPSAVLLGYCDIEETIRLLMDPRLVKAPTLIVDGRTRWPDMGGFDHVVVSDEPTFDALTRFAKEMGA